jgi:serine protease
MPTPASRPQVARTAVLTAVLALASTLVGRAADPVPGANVRAGAPPLASSTPAAAQAVPPAPPGQNRKQALLAGQWRPAEDTGVLRARATQGRPVPGVPSSLYVPGHVVVKFAPDMTESAMGAVAHDAGATRVVRPHHADFTYVEIPEGADPVAAAAEMAARPGVVYAEPDARVFPLYTPNDPLWQYQWNLQKLDLPKAWDINQGGKSSVVVAVIDTGVAYVDEGEMARAPDLAGTSFKPGFDFVWDDDRPVDLEGHGTHVTGTIAQTTNNNLGVAGLAFNVSIMPIKALFTDWDAILDAPYPYGSSTVARAIRFAADNGAQVINMSLGAFAPNQATRDALVYAVDKGVFVAVAAGNSGDTDNAPLYPAVYAKDIAGVVAVAAVDEALNRAPYSNSNDYVELAAPGGDVDADLNDDGYADGVLQQTLDADAVQSGVFNRFVYLFADGTSMASPHVAAFAALLIDQGITTPAAVEDAMTQFATDLGPTGRDNDTGYGLINPRATLRGLGLGR